MATPTSYPEWALQDETDPITGAENVLEPVLSFKQHGAKREQEVPRSFLNYQGRLINDWIKDLDERTPSTSEVALLAENNLDDLEDAATARTTLNVYSKSEVIETGSNANGVYTKFADGTLICTHELALGATYTASGSVYVTDASTWVLPYTSVGDVALSSGVDTTASPTWVSIGYTILSGINVVGYRGGDAAGASTARLIAIGRWF